MAEVMYGPIQMLAIGFENPDFRGQIWRELKNVSEKDIIRLIDVQFVWKDEAGDVTALEVSDLSEEEAMQFGAVIGGLIGLGAAGAEGAREGAEAGAYAVAERDFGLSEDDVNDIADAIPNNSAAAFMLIEHRWAIQLKGALRDAGGFLLSQGMLTPESLVLVGAALADAVEAAEEKEEKEEKKVPVYAR